MRHKQQWSESGNPRGIAYQQISFWLPLQEATVGNGSLRYIPGSNCGPILTHRSPNNDPRIMALECVGGFDPSRETFVPLRYSSSTANLQHLQ